MKTSVRPLRRSAALPLALAALAAGTAAAEPPQVHTDRSSDVTLPLPKGDDVFHFVVFGDRTGGPAEGIKVLAQAVTDTNLLDPDLVMTVGDLVNGYNQTPQWMTQMKEFRETMAGLTMPWFPVAGNHDVYWRRDPNKPEARPPREHEDNYEKHFGPLWYWFAHKQCGFLVLYTDEGPEDGGARSFSDPSQQRLSPKQMAWLSGALDEMKDLKHIFVFLHHPYWWDRYPGSNWDEVHQLLVKNGKVRAVLAGHVHRMSYSGERDGIGYYALATTGGSTAEHMGPYFGFLHHFNVVTVRDDGYSMAAIPVGQTLDPRQFDTLRKQDGDLLLDLHHRTASPPLDVAADGSATAIYRVSLDNPSSLPLEVSMHGDGRDQWLVTPSHRHATVPPSGRVEFTFACVREARTLEGFLPPRFEMGLEVLTPGRRIALPARTLEAVTRILPATSDTAPGDARDGQLAFQTRGAHLRIDPTLFDAPDGPFTIEAWIKPSGRGGAVVSNRRFDTGFGLEIMQTPGFFLHAAGEVSAAKADEALPADQWSHLAGVYDGSQIALYVNGHLVAKASAHGSPDRSADPLYVAAMPRGGWSRYNLPVPAADWQGAIDDVRLSTGARYVANFTPTAPLTSDETTIFHLPCDQQQDAFTPAHGTHPFLVPLVGKPAQLHESRGN